MINVSPIGETGYRVYKDCTCFVDFLKIGNCSKVYLKSLERSTGNSEQGCLRGVLMLVKMEYRMGENFHTIT